MWLAVQYGVPIVAYGSHVREVPFDIQHVRTLDDVRSFLIETLNVR